MSTIALRVAARFLKANDEVWLPDILGSKERVVRLLLQEIKHEVQHSRGQAGAKDPKSMAGGLCYFLVKERGGEAMAQKLWHLLDASAGLDAGQDVHRLADTAARHLTMGREKGSVEAAAVGVALLQRTRQMNKAQRANGILVDALGDRLEKYGPPEAEPKTTPSGAFAAAVVDQKALAQSVAGQLGGDAAKAAVVAWEVLTNVNAHDAASLAETVLSPLANETTEEGLQPTVSEVSMAVDYGIVEAGAFGVALMQAVNQPAYAAKLQRAMYSVFKEYLVPSL